MPRHGVIRRSVRRVSCLLALLAGPAAAGAQVMRVPRRVSDPAVWGSLGVAYAQLANVADGTTGSVWDFGSAAQWRASLEVPVATGTTVGVAGTYARPSLIYAGGGCAGGCDAHASVRTLVATVHGGGTLGFHQVFDIAVGGVQYADFRRDADDAALEPADGDVDLTFSIGYGFGYGLSRTTQLTLVQEYGGSIHQREGLAANARSLVQYYVTRVGARVGFGGR